MWQPACNSSQGKLPHGTSHIGKLWIWLREPASVNKVEKCSRIHRHEHTHTCTKHTCKWLGWGTSPKYSHVDLWSYLFFHNVASSFFQACPVHLAWFFPSQQPLPAPPPLPIVWGGRGAYDSIPYQHMKEVMNQPDSILRLKIILLQGQNKFMTIFCKTWVQPCLDTFSEIWHVLYPIANLHPDKLRCSAK